MTTINESFAAGLLADMQALAAEYNFEKQPGEFSINDFKNANHISSDKANCWLNKALEDGKVTARKVGVRMFFKMVK